MLVPDISNGSFTCLAGGGSRPGIESVARILLRVRIPPGVCGLTQASDALMDQVVAWDNRRFRRDLGELAETLRRAIRRGLAEFLDVC